MSRIAELRGIYNPLQSEYAQRLRARFALPRIPDPSHAVELDPDVDSKMMRDPDIAFAMSYLQLLAAGTGFHVEPGRNADKRMMLRSSVEESLLEHIRNFDEARFNLVYAELSGGRHAQIQGEIRTLTIGDGKPRKWAVPVFLRDMGKERFRLVTKGRGASRRVLTEVSTVDLSRPIYVPLTRPQDYITHRVGDVEEYGGNGHGMRERLAYPWTAKSHLFQIMSSACDRFGEGWVKITLPAGTDTSVGLSQTDRYNDALERVETLRKAGVLVLSEGEQAEILDGASQSFQMLTEYHGILAQQCTRVILAAVLPTGGGDMSVGSLARAGVEKTSTQVVAGGARSRLEKSLSEQLLDWCAYYNRPNYEALGIMDARAGIVKIDDDDAFSPQESADFLERVLGASPDIELVSDEVFEMIGMKRPNGSPDVIRGRGGEVPAPAMAAAQ